MIARHENNRWVRLSLLAAVLATIGWSAPSSTRAGDLDKIDSSLKLIPADASFYMTMLRNREQVEAVKNSKGWATLLKTPLAQMAFAQYEAQKTVPGSGPSQVQTALKNPEIQKLIDLAAVMASDEIFVYGDNGCADFLGLINEANDARAYAPVLALAAGHPLNADQMQTGAALSVLADDVKRINVPTLIVGFKLKKTDLAKEELIKLEMIVNTVLGMNEKMQGRFKKTKVGDHEYLVLALDGAMVPWKEVSEKLERAELKDGDAKKVMEQVEKTKLVIALGIRDDYLLAYVGSSLDGLEKLGKGDRLMDRAEFEPLAKYADRRLVSIGYVGEAIARLQKKEKQLNRLKSAVDQALSQDTSPLTDEQKARIRKDVQSLTDDIKTLMPDRGATVACSFLSDLGIEGYQYTKGGDRGMDASKPLTLLQHVGGSPIFGIVGRRTVDIKNYDLFVKWAKIGYGYYVDFAMPNFPETEREKAEQFFKSAIPLLERFDKATREMLFPALADGQTAFVIDAKLMTKQLQKRLPTTQNPMPILEPAIVVGVSDAALLKKGFGEYREVINGLIDAVRQVEGAHVPDDLEIPEPTVTDNSAGKIYSFELPKEWGLDEQIVLNFGLSEKVGVFSASLAHTQRLLTATPPSVGGLVSKTDEPLGAVGWLNWSQLLETASPWADFAVEHSVPSQKDDQKTAQKAIAEQVHTIRDILKAIRAVTVDCRIEDGVLVSHSLLEIHDIGQ
jgi:hypothetical protein